MIVDFDKSFSKSLSKIKDVSVLKRIESVILKLLAQAQQREPVDLTDIFVFPNPSNGQLTIELKGIKEIAHFQIINTLGQQLHQWQNTDNVLSVNLNVLGLSSGLYHLHAQTEEGKIYRKKFLYQKQ